MSNRERLQAENILYAIAPHEFRLRGSYTKKARVAGRELIEKIVVQRLWSKNRQKESINNLSTERDRGTIDNDHFAYMMVQLQEQYRTTTNSLNNLESIIPVFFGVKGNLDRYAVFQGKSALRFELDEEYYGFVAQSELSDLETQIIFETLNVDVRYCVPFVYPAYNYLPDGYIQKDAKGRVVNRNARLLKTDLTNDSGIVVCCQKNSTGSPLNPVLLKYPPGLLI